MDMLDLLRHYRTYNPETGEFDRSRTNREYAALLGVHESYLSRCFDGKQPINLRVLRGLAQAFPASADEVKRALMAEPHADHASQTAVAV